MVEQANLPAIFECISPGCKFRFPVQTLTELRAASICPRCGSPTLMMEVKIPPQTAPMQSHSDVNNLHLEVLVDNIRSANNIGSIFRTADGVGLSHLYLCGVTPTPPHPAIAKTALGAENHVRWSYVSNGIDLLSEKRHSGYFILALEGGADSSPIIDLDLQPSQEKVILVIGNEISGVDPAILRLCDQRLWIPMCGVKESLNVSIAFAIAVYIITYRLKSPPF